VQDQGVQTREICRASEADSTHVELLRGERSTSDSRGVRLDDTNNLLDDGRWDSQSSTYTSDRSRRRSDERISPVIDIQHERIGTLNENPLVLRDRLVEEHWSIDDVRSKSLGKSQVLFDLGLGIVLEVSISLETTLNECPKLGRELGAVEVVHSESGSGSLGRVSWANSSSGRSDTTGPAAERLPRKNQLQQRDCMRGRRVFSPGSAQFDLLESVDDLVETHDQVRSVRDEKTTGAVQSCNQDSMRPGRISACVQTCHISSRSQLTLLLDIVKLFEHGREVDNQSGTDESDALGVDQTCKCQR
jgi:hypothetical protein